MIGRAALVSAPLLLLAACTVGPNYRRPPVSTPGAYYHAAPAPSPNPASLADEKWWALFQDPQLQQLIRTALQHNYDVRIAASRIAQAQAQVGLARANQLPTVSANASVLTEKLPIFSFNVFQILGSFAWNPDFWGQYRRATEAARASLLASQWARQEVIATMISNVAMAYFELRELDLERDISQKTLGSRQESLKLTQTLLNGGAAGLLDVRQAQQLVETAAENIPDVDRQIGQQEDLLSTLIGDNPHAIPRGLPLTAQPAPPTVPSGLPSSLLERRPDVRQAEERLAAATANIGVARALFFPSLALTGTAGMQSSTLAGLFTAPAVAWNASAPLTQPIFEGGRLHANLKLSEAQQQEALLTYKQTIQTAFRQVSDALIAYSKYRDYTGHQVLLTAAAQDADRLSNMRYRAGSTSYLEVLTSETNYFAAQLSLARARLNERLSLVQLYIALGGGWQQ
jgi:outer membrane protein, multidrug efflux system